MRREEKIWKAKKKTVVVVVVIIIIITTRMTMTMMNCELRW